MKQAKTVVAKVVEEVGKLSNPSGEVKLTLSAVAYNDWDPDTAKRGRPVVSVFGGREIKESHSNSLTPASFNLGGKFTSNGQELESFVEQALGHGGQVPEELTGGLIAASHLPWSADIRMCVVITDAPCHGKAYHDSKEDTFADATTGLTCAGSPEAPLKSLVAKQVELTVIHTGKVGKMIQEFKKLVPLMKDGNVTPADTGSYLMKQIKEKLGVSPLNYHVGVYGLDDLPNTAPANGTTIDIQGCTIQQKSMKIGHDGLAWFGYPGQDFTGTPEVKVRRATDAALDSYWTTESKFERVVGQFQVGAAAICSMPAKP
eukprot:SRR837773.19610.p1 GENE.SRR837773.19610~~SRR837773.19610.p1  ORF type:complete len:326 (-),score=80.64 SRR837773.19610:95-1045(-)